MPDSRPFGLEWRSNTLFILSSVIIGLFSDIFLYSLFVPILPYMLEDRAAIPNEKVQVHVSGLLASYAGAAVLFSPVAGWIADRTSQRRTPFLCGLLALLAGTVSLYFARTEPVMIFARILQGLSSAVVWSVGLAVALDTVGPENMGKTMGTAFSVTSVGGLLGPVLGGLLFEAAGYLGVFGLGWTILVVDVAMRVLVIEKKVASKHIPEEREADERQPLLKHDEHEIPPDQPDWIRAAPLLYCFKSPNLVAAQFLTLVQAILVGSFDATIPTTAQSIFDFTPLTAGLLFIPIAFSDLLVGPLAGWTVDHFGPKPAAVLGYIFLIPVLVCLRLVRRGDLILYCALLVLAGIGTSAVGAPPVVEASSVVSKYQDANPGFFGENGPFAKLYGITSMIFNLGLTLGPLGAGTLRDAIGYGDMNAVLAGICLVTAAVSFVYIGERPAESWSRHVRKAR